MARLFRPEFDEYDWRELKRLMRTIDAENASSRQQREAQAEKLFLDKRLPNRKLKS